MKKLTIIILLLAMTSILMSYQIEPDKFAHFTGVAGLYILSDCVCEWTGLPRYYVPITLCLSVSFAKEFTDPFFNWNDIIADGAGLTFGFAVRFADFKQGR